MRLLDLRNIAALLACLLIALRALPAGAQLPPAPPPKAGQDPPAPPPKPPAQAQPQPRAPQPQAQPQPQMPQPQAQPQPQVSQPQAPEPHRRLAQPRFFAEPAQDPNAPPPPPPAPGAWYGWQTLVVDGASLFLGLALAQTLDVEADGLGVAAATWYGASAVAVPAVHHAHGNWELGVSSLGLRSLAPPVAGLFGLLGACIAHSEFDRECARPGWAGGTLVGLVGAAALDAMNARDPAVGKPSYALWYGWQLMLLDALGYGLGAYFAAKNPRNDDGEKIPPAIGLWVGAYTVGFIAAPITHFAHGNVGTGFASLGLRLFVGPLGALLGLIGYCSATAGSDGCTETGAVWGLVGGGLAVSLFDAFALAHEETPAPQKYTTTASLGPGALVIKGYF